MNGIDSLVVGHFGEVIKGFKQLICTQLRFIQEKVQSCARLYDDKDLDWTNDTSGTPQPVSDEEDEL